MTDDKYVVLKREDWEGLQERIGQLAGPPMVLDALTIQDAVVIRTHDSFAAGGLSAYAHNIQTAIELSGRGLVNPTRANLEITRDYFMDRAKEAEDILRAGHSKLPD